MTGSLFPLLRAAAASEIAKAFGQSEGQPPAKTDTAIGSTAARGTAQGPLSDHLNTLLQTLKLTQQDVGLSGLAVPRPLAVLADPSALLPAPLLHDKAGASAAEAQLKDRAALAGTGQTDSAISAAGRHAPEQNPLAPPSTRKEQPLHTPLPLSDAPAPAQPSTPNDGSAAFPSAMKSALPAAMAEAMSYGAFPFTLGGQSASAASLVIFNAAMAPAWPPALRLDQMTQDLAQIRVAGSQLAQMTPEETAEFLAKMAAIFGFLLVVKKRLSRSLKEEKESILGLFALFGVAMDTLVKGMQLAFDLTADQREILERISVETGGQPSGRGQSRHRVKL